MLPANALTPEQQRIVHHDDGPALVFAVAGAGKTTAMVHRIRHLVQTRNVPAQHILASSFSKATVTDVSDGLQALGVRGVACHTLHALGRRFIQIAEANKHLPARLGQQGPNPDTAAHYLAERALSQLAQEREVDASDLGIAHADLVDQIGAWKRQLCYADLQAAHLPDRAQSHASQATHDNEDYLTLYQYAEAERDKEGWITFDDMLMEGWEALMRFSTVRDRAQQMFAHVLVDEFQDVSRVQYRILDVLTAPHRNYMAIGDDDQCIYAWRGANPSYILGFCDDYDATEYILRDNFRSHAQQTALANRVITHNTARRTKRIHCTKGCEGTTHCTAASDASEEATGIASAIQTYLRNGYAPTDMVILVRQYAQTPFIEQALLEAGVSYRIVGNTPFYMRSEVQTLLHYLYWATLEATVQARGWFADPRKTKPYLDRFKKLLRTPNRYVSYAVVQQATRAAAREQTSVLDALAAHTDAMHERTVEQVEDFLEVAEGLVARVDEDASETLAWLIQALEYEAHLRGHSAFVDVAENRVQTARSLVSFAEGHDSAQALLNTIYRIANARPDRSRTKEVLTLRSIHRAKGGEWPIVFLPGCNQGTLPPGRNGSSQAIPEEERRLFYVAVTRAQETLHCSYTTEEERSPFLEEAEVDAVQEQCDTLRSLLQKAPDALTPTDAVAFCAAVGELDLTRYVQTWWEPATAYRQALIKQIERAEATAQQRLAQGDAPFLDIPVSKRTDIVSATKPFTFTSSEHTNRIQVYQNDRRIGYVDRNHTDQAPAFEALPWDELTAHLVRRTTSGKMLYLRPGATPSQTEEASQPFITVLSTAYQRGKEALAE